MAIKVNVIQGDDSHHLANQINDFLKGINYQHHSIQYLHTAVEEHPGGGEDIGTRINHYYTAWIDYTVEAEGLTAAESEANLKAGLQKHFGKKGGVG